jgi:hypothetical protein
MFEQGLPASPVFDGTLYNEPDGGFSILACLQCIQQVAAPNLNSAQPSSTRRSLIHTRRSSRSGAFWERGGPPPTSKSTIM